MNEEQLLLKDTVERLFAELSASRPEPDAVADAFAARWVQFEAMGLQGVLVPEAEGGFGGGGLESWLVCHAAGRHAIDLPVVEAIIAAGLLAAAGLPIPDGVLSVATRVDGKLDKGEFAGTLHGVPWGRHADHVVGIIDSGDSKRLICIATAGTQIEHHANMADEPRDGLHIASSTIASAPYTGIDIRHHGALARSALIAGASRAAMDLAIKHVLDRSQFGKPLAKFQAVQHSLATLAEQVAAAEAASRAAFEAGGGLLETASAKIVANLASEAAVSIAHQMHGAIGFTWEYALHHCTRRLMAWRAEFGNARYWNGVLGTLAAEQGADDYWAFVVAGSAVSET